MSMFVTSQPCKEIEAERDRYKAALEAIADHNVHGFTLQTELAKKALKQEGEDA